MKMRPYIESRDYKYLVKWIDNERIHALWCKNLIPYPVTMENFHDFLERNANKWADSAYVVTEDDGKTIGFFCYSINTENHEGFLKFIIIDNKMRGRGYGRGMLQLALQYAFDVTKAETVQINVFLENTDAKHCYESLGFVERSVEKDVFKYKDELWSRCNMVITR